MHDPEFQSGAVIYTASPARLADFYCQALGFRERARDATHVALEIDAMELVLLTADGANEASSFASSKPAARRSEAAIKPVFVVPSIAVVRARAPEVGGVVNARSQEWRYGAFRVCDALDPDGNVIQLRERLTDAAPVERSLAKALDGTKHGLINKDRMYHELILRIVIMRPPSGVDWRVQSGRDELLAPRSASPEEITFEVNVNVTNQGPVIFRGAVAQGPPKARFIYVNSGTRAGQVASCWNRRAKISLAGITRAQVARALANSDSLLESRIAGTSRDGGPACATVPLLDGWRLVPAPSNNRER